MKNELLELAKKIDDKNLRKKVIEFIKDPKLTNEDFKKYKAEKLEKGGSIFVVSGPTSMGPVERDILHHTLALGDLCLKIADFMKEKFGIPLNRDYMLAAAILHDMMKLFEFKRGEDGLEPTGVMLDHTMLAVAEFYHRGFPEDVIHIIASHPGEAGTTPPRNFESLIFHHLDSMLSIVEYYLYSKTRQMLAEKMMKEKRLVAIPEDDLKKLIGERTGIENSSED